MPTNSTNPRIAVVGPCGSGKSTLVGQLRARGWEVRMPAQEHSGVADMWQRMLHPDLLIALDAPNEVLRARRPGIYLTNAILDAQRERLAHARAHADLTLDTSQADVETTVAHIVAWLEGSM